MKRQFSDGWQRNKLLEIFDFLYTLLAPLWGIFQASLNSTAKTFCKPTAFCSSLLGILAIFCLKKNSLKSYLPSIPTVPILNDCQCDSGKRQNFYLHVPSFNSSLGGREYFEMKWFWK
jgi:hypothetical protein